MALVVDHWTTNKKIVGSNPAGIAGCVLEQDTFTPYNTFVLINTQETVVSSRHD